MTDRPKRKAMSLRVKLDSALYALGLDPETTEFDHDPALGLRPVNDAGTDYDPPQLDPHHIVPRTKPTHARKTDGDPEIPLSGDKAKIAKVKRLEGQQERHLAAMRAEILSVPLHDVSARPKRKIPSRPFQKRRRVP